MYQIAIQSFYIKQLLWLAHTGK